MGRIPGTRTATPNSLCRWTPRVPAHRTSAGGPGPAPRRNRAPGVRPSSCRRNFQNHSTRSSNRPAGRPWPYLVATRLSRGGTSVRSLPCGPSSRRSISCGRRLRSPRPGRPCRCPFPAGNARTSPRRRYRRRGRHLPRESPARVVLQICGHPPTGGRRVRESLPSLLPVRPVRQRALPGRENPPVRPVRQTALRGPETRLRGAPRRAAHPFGRRPAARPSLQLQGKARRSGPKISCFFASDSPFGNGTGGPLSRTLSTF